LLEICVLLKEAFKAYCFYLFLVFAAHKNSHHV